MKRCDDFSFCWINDYNIYYLFKVVVLEKEAQIHKVINAFKKQSRAGEMSEFSSLQSSQHPR